MPTAKSISGLIAMIESTSYCKELRNYPVDSRRGAYCLNLTSGVGTPPIRTVVVSYGREKKRSRVQVLKTLLEYCGVVRAFNSPEEFPELTGMNLNQAFQFIRFCKNAATQPSEVE